MKIENLDRAHTLNIKLSRFAGAHDYLCKVLDTINTYDRQEDPCETVIDFGYNGTLAINGFACPLPIDVLPDLKKYYEKAIASITAEIEVL